MGPMSIETVVVAVDREDTAMTEQVVDAAVDVASATDATVALACVYENDEYAETRERLQFESDSEATPTRIAERNVAVRDAAERLTDAEVDVTTIGRLAKGTDPGKCLAEIAADLDADRLQIGGRDRSPVGKAVFGSTAQTAMLNAPCPVTLIRVD